MPLPALPVWPFTALTNSETHLPACMPACLPACLPPVVSSAPCDLLPCCRPPSVHRHCCFGGSSGRARKARSVFVCLFVCIFERGRRTSGFLSTAECNKPMAWPMVRRRGRLRSACLAAFLLIFLAGRFPGCLPGCLPGRLAACLPASLATSNPCLPGLCGGQRAPNPCCLPDLDLKPAQLPGTQQKN